MSLINLKVTEKLTIKCLRPSSDNRIDVVSADKDKVNNSKQHTRWLTSSPAGARAKGEQWYPVKFGSIVKQSVLDQNVNDRMTLQKDFEKDSEADNGSGMAECIPLETTRLSKVDAEEKAGSMVVWLKSKVDAEYLLRT